MESALPIGMLAGEPAPNVVRGEGGGVLRRREFRQDGQMSNLSPYVDRRIMPTMLESINVPYFRRLDIILLDRLVPPNKIHNATQYI